jgi:PAS domain S-box-containing protein
MTSNRPIAEGSDAEDRVEHDELVLVVDDDRDVAETTARMLEQRGLDVVWGSSAEDGLDCLKERRDEIAAVVSDYQMPGMDGLELLESMREVSPYLPFVLFTGKGSERIASEAIDAGVSSYIQKRGTEQYDRVANRVTEAMTKRRTQRELEETKARFDALTQNTSFAIVTIDANSEIKYANSGVEGLFGYSPDELVGESLTAIIPDRLVETHREGIQRYLRTGEKHLDWDWIELPAVTRDGEEISVGVTFGERENNTQHLFTGIIRDISEQKARREALRKEKERFEAVFENALDSIFILDPDSKTICEANPVASEMLGYSREELRGMNIQEIHPDDYAELLDFAEDVLHGDPGWYNTRCHTASGDVIPAEIAGSEMMYDDQTCLLSVIRPEN